MMPRPLQTPISRRAQFFLTVVLLLLLWILPGCFSGMHDSDQAAVVGDAWELANGIGREPGVFYNYDKLFVTHWFLAGLFWAMRQLGSSDVVLVGNLGVSILISAAILTVQKVTKFQWRGYVAFLVVLLTPAFLSHVPFMAPAFVSAAFLLFLFAVIEACRGRVRPGHHVLIALLVFAAIGARADAVLALPFFVWLYVPIGRAPWRAWKTRIIPAIGVGAAAAIMVSLQLRDPDAIYAGDLGFNAKAFLAYVVFGLGGSLILIAWAVLRIGALSFRSTTRPRFGWVIGAGAFALPFLFYTMQLYSTRYWTLGVTLLLLWICSRRGRVLLQSASARWVVIPAALAAVIPLGVGFSVSNPRQIPHLVLNGATAFPSADGLIPMGAYVAFDYARRDPATGGARDHNEAVFLAGRAATFIPDADGTVPMLITPTYSLLRLGVLLQGMRARGYKSYEMPPVWYADTRSLVKFLRPLRAHEEAKDSMGEVITHAAIDAVSPEFRGIAVQRVEMGAGRSQSRPLWDVFRSIFRGDEFWPREGQEVWSADRTFKFDLGRGATVAMLSPEPFELLVMERDLSTRKVASAALDGFPTWQGVILDGRETNAAAVKLSEISSPGARIYSAEAILPDYMSQARNQP